VGLAKAKLIEIKKEPKGGEPELGTALEVQFNPATLKLSLANQVDPQHTHGQQRRQFLGASSTSLAFDLVFDTAEEGTTTAPVSVRTRTAMVERFLLPTQDKPSPPRVRFEWNELRLDGVIESLSIDFDLFAYDGTPLRAKMSVTIKEQNRKYQAAQLGPAARSARDAPAPGGGGTGPGSSARTAGGLAAGARTEAALGGESAAQFAARVGLDPAVWRGIAGAVDNPLAIGGGVEVSFDPSLGTGGALGVSVGVEIGARATLEQEFGLEPKASVPTRDGLALGPEGSAGFRLAAAGGLRPAIDRVAKQQSETAAAAARASFGPSVAGATMLPPPAAPSAPPQSHTPLRQTGLPGPTISRRAGPAPPFPTPDPRATAFGLGVPLRPSVRGAAGGLPATRRCGVVLRPDEAPTGAPPTARDPTAAPWTYLPAETAAPEPRGSRPARPAGCACRPGCGGHSR
jgi:hypothetical protein